MGEICVNIPIYHPDGKFEELLSSLRRQRGVRFSLLIMDSGSDGSWREHTEGLQIEVHKVMPGTFNHGGTRDKACKLAPWADYYILLTQDAILADDWALKNLLAAFEDGLVGCAYGRQLPHKGAGIFASFHRGFNYPAQDYVRSFADRKKYGIKTAFLSDSFAAYRREALEKIGGFPKNVICSEDMYAAAKMLQAGLKVAYRSDAMAHHSHDYTLAEEFKRSFDTGVFQGREAWIGHTFGKAEGEGLRFVREETAYLLKTAPHLLPAMLLRDAVKLIGYQFGKREKYLLLAIKKRFSMNKGFWQKNKAPQGEA